MKKDKWSAVVEKLEELEDIIKNMPEEETKTQEDIEKSYKDKVIDSALFYALTSALDKDEEPIWEEFLEKGYEFNELKNASEIYIMSKVFMSRFKKDGNTSKEEYTKTVVAAMEEMHEGQRLDLEAAFDYYLAARDSYAWGE